MKTKQEKIKQRIHISQSYYLHLQAYSESNDK